MTLIRYKGKANMFRKDAESVSEVFDSFKVRPGILVQIEDYDILSILYTSTTL